MIRRLWHFHGGIRLPGHKSESTAQPIRTVPVPPRLVVPLHQHIGEDTEPVVEVGERVRTGQVIARGHGYISAPVHAPSSGTVTAIEPHPVPHPSGLSAPCIFIDTDGRDEWIEPRECMPDYERYDPASVRERIRQAGIVGLGGAGFPTYVKLNPGAYGYAEHLLVNGAECEPYISCDDRLLRERAEEVVLGARIMAHALRARHVTIAVEDTMRAAEQALRAAVRALDAGDIRVVRVPTIYPTGGEKQLIRVVTGREVPSDGLPIDVGVVCQNVGTAAAVYRAVVQGEPLIRRIVTVTGRAVAHPGNVEARIGTPLQVLLRECGGLLQAPARLIMGGPMMGFPLAGDHVPVIKTTNCILAPTPEELPAPPPPQPCIRCGECARVCPARLLPQQLYWHAMSRDLDGTQRYHLFDCIECGCCAYVCPSHIPLVQYYRFAKSAYWARERERAQAELAKARHEAREARLQREAALREERLQQRRAKLQAQDPRKAEIAAAVERARQRRKAQLEGAGKPGPSDR